MKNNELFVRKAREQTEKYAIKKSAKRKEEVTVESPEQEKRVEVSDKDVKKEEEAKGDTVDTTKGDANDTVDANAGENEAIDSSESSEASWSDCHFLFYESFILLLLRGQEGTFRGREENTRFGGHCQLITFLPFLGVTGDSQSLHL